MTNASTVFNEVGERLANIARGLSIKTSLIDKKCVERNWLGWGRVWSRQGDVTDKKEWLIVLECNVFLFGVMEPVMKCVGKS